MFKIIRTYICKKKKKKYVHIYIYKMQHLEGSGTPVLYTRFLKLKDRATGSGFGSRKKIGFLHPPSKCGAAKNIYTKQERLPLIGRVNWS
jgi:hypothetical protein